MGTTAKGAIPSTTREGGFVAIDKRRNPRITTTENYATELSREFVATKKRSYTTK
jgi:hypothetical protein